ncbi:MAG: hypothetical protein ACRDV3_05365 [Acidothermaceae bacterium]
MYSFELLLLVITTSTLGSVIDFGLNLYVESVSCTLAFAIESPLHAMTIWAPGTTKTLLPVETDTEGDGLAGCDDDAAVGGGDDDAGGSGDAGELAGGGVVVGSGLGEFVGVGE